MEKQANYLQKLMSCFSENFCYCFSTFVENLKVNKKYTGSFFSKFEHSL